MKKWIIVVVSIVVMPIAEALTLFGEEVSMLVLIPLILIFIVLAAFVFMIIKDKIKSKSIGADTESALPGPGSPGDFGEPPLAELPSGEKPAKEEIAAIQEKQGLKTDYLEEVEAIERELSTIGTEDACKKINELIKGFFAEYAGVNYNFTFEELEKELKKANKKIQCFSDNLSSINYSPGGVLREDLDELLSEFKNIIISVKEENLSLTPEFKKELKLEEKKISKLLKKGEKSIGKDTSMAREDYDEIFELYKMLPDEEKEAIRPAVMDFYNKIQ